MIVSFYLSGIGTAMFAIAGLYFLKFWKASRDRFFAFLCASCWLLSFERMVGLGTYITLPTDEATLDHVRGWIYLIRFVVFVLILVAVIDKNRSTT